jgi:hypothetical protein
MTDSTRREILERLDELSRLAPDMRFGQLIANMSYLAIGPSPESIWDVEDAELLQAIKQQIENLSYRRNDNITPAAASGR